MKPRDYWYILFALFTISALPIGIISAHTCRHFSVWLIVHSFICSTYYAFMLYFYSTFASENQSLCKGYASLQQARDSVLSQLGCEPDEYTSSGDASIHTSLPEAENIKSVKLRSHEWGCLIFFIAYAMSLLLGIILYTQDRVCEPWVTYYGLSLLVTSVVGVIGNSCLQGISYK